MLVFFNARLVCLAVPKTGTTAIEEALDDKASAVFRNPPGIKHTNAHIFERKFRQLFDKPNLPPVETCAVIRHPLDWLGSWFRYRQRDQLKGHPNSTADLSFDEFVEDYLQDQQSPFSRVGSQAKFVSSPNGEILVSHLFSYDRFGEYIDFLSECLKTKIDPKMKNVSPKAELTLDPALEQRVRAHLAADFKIYESL